MAEDWFTRCADIINMDLTQPSHVKVVNEPDTYRYHGMDIDGTPEPADAWDQTTNTDRDYELTIRFDALTELEARLAISFVIGAVKRRTTVVDPVFITDLNPQGVA